MLTNSPPFSAGQARVLEMIATGAPLFPILDALVRIIEAEAGDLIASILLLAEGVESAAQCAFLHTHGCDAIQGHYFSAPVPAERIAEMLASGQRLDMQAGGENAGSAQSV